VKRLILVLGSLIVACSSERRDAPASMSSTSGAVGGGGEGAATGGLEAICDAAEQSVDCGFFIEDTGLECFSSSVEVFPNRATCEGSTTTFACIGSSHGVAAYCSADDCPAEPPGNAYYYRELEDGSVQLWHFQDDGCVTVGLPAGFLKCQMKANEPMGMSLPLRAVMTHSDKWRHLRPKEAPCAAT
jgi:hypothetical protein